MDMGTEGHRDMGSQGQMDTGTQDHGDTGTHGGGTGAHLAPPPPSTRAMVLPVRTRARREKSLWRSALFSNTFSYISRCGGGHGARR